MFDKEVVIVDDDPMVLDKVQKDFESESFLLNIHKALNGHEALSLTRKLKRMGKKIALFVIDYEMPIMNGLELLEEIKSSPSLKKIPVLMLTSANDRARVLKAINSGVTNYCLKPWNRDELIEKVHFCLEKYNAEESKLGQS